MKRLTLALFLIICASCAIAQRENQRCLRGATTIRKQFQDVTVDIQKSQDVKDGDVCRAVVRKAGKNVFTTHDWGLEIPLIGEDVNGDGEPDLVLEGYTGGAHCCWIYYIISLGSRAGLLKQIYNERGAAFVRNERTGRMEIQTHDGAFDYVFLSHAEAPFPSVYLSLEGTRLIDVGARHVAEYDREIDEAKRRLSEEKLRAFYAATNSEGAWANDSNREAAADVLQIIYAYLYSGRQSEAHDALTTMWPPFDQERAWKLILETRQKGILKYTRSMPGRKTQPRAAVLHSR